MAEGFGMEMEEMGMVALIGVLLLPGVIWIAKGKTMPSMLGRMAVVGGVIAAAVTLEASMDKTVDEITD